jgi:hypothetical protein
MISIHWTTAIGLFWFGMLVESAFCIYFGVVRTTSDTLVFDAMVVFLIMPNAMAWILARRASRRIGQ